MPWIFFGLAFVFIGLPSLSEHLKQFSPRHELAVAASAFYSFASSAGFCKSSFSLKHISTPKLTTIFRILSVVFFSSNFGEEAGGTTDSWVRRACIVQGTQQVWVSLISFEPLKERNTFFDLFVRIS
jgi:alpha-1,3-glucan synthase